MGQEVVKLASAFPDEMREHLPFLLAFQIGAR
jgi:hypothetical protein